MKTNENKNENEHENMKMNLKDQNERPPWLLQRREVGEICLGNAR